MSRLADPPPPTSAVGREPARAPRLVGWLWCLWAGFVVYGSLVPLEFHAVPLAEAWARLAQAPMLQIDVGGRADWVANGVLYVPVGFLGTAGLLGTGRAGPWRAALALLGGWSAGLVLALAVEFSQVFFPPRTVSLNDLLAEGLGALLGALTALVGGTAFKALLAAFGADGATLRRWLGPAYLLAFLALVLFPFDLLLHADEWLDKLRGDHLAWLLASTDAHLGRVRTAAKLLVETGAVVPLGAWWMSRQGAAPGSAASPWRQAFAIGLFLGLAIETAQLALASGVSQGLSVLTRGLGFAAGAVLWRRSTAVHVEATRAALRRVTGPLILVYVPLLTVQFGWWQGPWMSVDRALQRLQLEIHFVPLYYHYYTSEANALVSLLAAVSSYAPVGGLGWAWHLGAGTSATLAAALALLIEAGRLMVAETKPDPSNLLIAAAAAGLTHVLTRRLAADWPGSGRSRP